MIQDCIRYTAPWTPEISASVSAGDPRPEQHWIESIWRPEAPGVHMADERRDSTTGVPNSGGADIKAENAPGQNIPTVQALDDSRVFQPVIEAIQQAPHPMKSEALEHVEKLKHEAAKGEDADHHLITTLLDGIAVLVPDAIKALATALGNPIIGPISGPATRHLFSKHIDR